MSRSIYYRRRAAPQGGTDFEVGYWGPVRDPDGVLRDPSQERDKKVEDLAGELAFVNALPAGRILDVGCGLGHLLSGVDSRWERHGVEISGYAAERAREHGTIVHGTLRSARYPDAWFDVVTIYHVIEHMDDPVAELREIRRVLRPGGALVVGTPNFDSACARRFGERFRLLHDATHISLFGAASLRTLLEDEGFAVEREEFPFFETRYFTKENLDRLFRTEELSPPFHGSIMTFYARRPENSEAADAAGRSLRLAWRLLQDRGAEVEKGRAILDAARRSGRTVHVAGRHASRRSSQLSAMGLHALIVPPGSLSMAAGRGDVLVAFFEPGLDGVLREATARGISTIVLTDESSSERPECDVLLEVRSSSAEMTQRAHDVLLPIVAERVSADDVGDRPGGRLPRVDAAHA